MVVQSTTSAQNISTVSISPNTHSTITPSIPHTFGHPFPLVPRPSESANEPNSTFPGGISKTSQGPTVASTTPTLLAPPSNASSASLQSSTLPTANASNTPKGGGNSTFPRDITVISALLGSFVLIIAIVTIVLYRRIIRRAIVSKLFKNAEFLSIENPPEGRVSSSVSYDIEMALDKAEVIAAPANS